MGHDSLDVSLKVVNLYDEISPGEIQSLKDDCEKHEMELLPALDGRQRWE